MRVVQSVAFSGPTKLINNAHLTNFPSRLDAPATYYRPRFQSAGNLVTARTTPLFPFPFYRHRAPSGTKYTSLPHISIGSTRPVRLRLSSRRPNFIAAESRPGYYTLRSRQRNETACCAKNIERNVIFDE